MRPAYSLLWEDCVDAEGDGECDEEKCNEKCKEKHGKNWIPVRRDFSGWKMGGYVVDTLSGEVTGRRVILCANPIET